MSVCIHAFMCVHMSVPVCRGSQRSTRGILPSPHLTFQQSLSLKLELPSWLGGLDGKAPGPCLCLPNAGVTEPPLHSDAFRSVLPSFHTPFLSRILYMCRVLRSHSKFQGLQVFPHPLYYLLPTSCLFSCCCCCCPESMYLAG